MNFITTLLKNGYKTMMLLCIQRIKFVVADRFIKTLKIKIYKYITSISKNMYIGKLDHIVNEYSNIDHN